MIDILLGIGAIISVVVILLMRESENKIVGYIGLGIIIVGKLSSGADGIDEGLAIFLIVGMIVVGAAIQYNKTKKSRKSDDYFNDFMESVINKKDVDESENTLGNIITNNDSDNDIFFNHNSDDVYSIASYEKLIRFKKVNIEDGFNEQLISYDAYKEKLEELESEYQAIQYRYNVTREDIKKYYNYHY